ncbi:MAG: class I SAM-dependent methyltransferase [Bacteroidota bacterium]|nr:class I SAM-dependent methyltransferase [Bacteroidota bacterium]MDP4230721.1 class I SAM-dependent methyltransferase [Bacteroidota bacterium]
MQHQEISSTGQLANEYIAKGDITGWFEELYERSEGNASAIPWAGEKPNPYLVEWLESHRVSGNGKKALVIGCGLGDDAEALAGRGYKVTAFDISPTAIAWAKKRFASSDVEYRVEDLFKLPQNLKGAFDFVFESYTIQALPRSVRSEVIEAVASVVAPGGSLLLVCRGWRDGQTEDNLPWALKKEELAHFGDLGFSQETFEEFWDREDPDRYRYRILYRKA